MPKEHSPSSTTEQKDTGDSMRPKSTIRAIPQPLKGKIHTLLLVDVDPKRCRPWPYHNRDAAWLTKERCADLIHSIQQEGQLDPILVRTLSRDADYDYEVIYGVRRTFACSQIPNQPVTARVTDLDDKSCMVLMHAENANSKDISEFERAFSFAQQMKSGHFKNQSEMAKIMGYSQSAISKMIRAAEIFKVEWIALLFQNKIDIPVKPGYTLSLLLQHTQIYERIKTEAMLIQKDIAKNGFLPASKVLHKLITAGTGKNAPSESIILTIDNLPVVYCTQEKSGKFTIFIANEAKKLKALDIEAACLKALREHILQELFLGNNSNL